MEERALQPIISLASSEWANVAIQRRVAWALSGVGLAMSGMTDVQYARVDAVEVRCADVWWHPLLSCLSNVCRIGWCVSRQWKLTHYCLFFFVCSTFSPCSSCLCISLNNHSTSSHNAKRLELLDAFASDQIYNFKLQKCRSRRCCCTLHLNLRRHMRHRFTRRRTTQRTKRHCSRLCVAWPISV
jgi:hypothetical protein